MIHEFETETFDAIAGADEELWANMACCMWRHLACVEGCTGFGLTSQHL
jgi:hypothetical protein